jgi:PhnB protein
MFSWARPSGCRASSIARPGAPVNPAMLYLYVENADAWHDRAVRAGAKSVMPMTDQFYGDRSGGVEDPSGNQWWLATRKEDLSPEEVIRRAKAHGKG